MKNVFSNLTGILSVAALILFLTGCCSLKERVPQPGPMQTVFKSPDDAVKALLESAKKNDTNSLLGIFGEAGRDIVMSGDIGEDTETRKIVSKKADEKMSVSTVGNKKFIIIGKEEWSFPVPIVSNGSGWFFDTAEGKDELLTRRIGRNELNTIKVCRAFVKAQQEYAAKDRDGDGIRAYAARLCSDPGKKNGLYWESNDINLPSPIGPLMAAAAAEEVDNNTVAPYHGYLFKILASQGKFAPGGKKNYIKDNKMTNGFALLAYPSNYGDTGVMSFIVSDMGIIYQKNLGKNTAESARKIIEYNPDATWTPVLYE